MLYTSLGQVSSTFKADKRRNLVSVLAKITPSPDWSVGVDRINLCDGNCTWKKQIVQDLYPWDAGKTYFFKICFFVKYFRQRLLSLVNMGLHAAIIRLTIWWVASVTPPLKNPGYAPDIEQIPSVWTGHHGCLLSRTTLCLITLKVLSSPWR